MKTPLHIFAVTRIKIETEIDPNNITAEAIDEAIDGVDLYDAVRNSEYAEDIQGVMVDVPDESSEEGYHGVFFDNIAGNFVQGDSLESRYNELLQFVRETALTAKDGECIKDGQVVDDDNAEMSIDEAYDAVSTIVNSARTLLDKHSA